jgi:hypothetical protein
MATSEMLRRSKGVTLIVKATGSSAVCENVRMVIPHIERVSALHLCFSAGLLQPLLSDIFVTSLAYLDSLRLTAHRTGPPFDMPDAITAILTRYSPSLRLFELTHCKFSWQSLHLHGLTHLELRNLILPPDSLPTIAQIVSLLRGVPMLDTLILDHVLLTQLPNETHSDVTSSRQYFPYLRVLTLGGRVSSCTYLLDQITYPITTIATFRCNVPSTESSIFHKLFLAIQSAVLDEGGDHIIHTFEVHAIPLFFFLRCLARHSSAPPDPSLEAPRLTVSLTWANYHQVPFSEVLCSATAAFLLAGVQDLHLSHSYFDLSELEWTNFLECFPMTHTIYHSHGPPAEFLKVIAEGREKAMVSAGPILPRLRCLHVTGADFSNSGWNEFNLVCSLLAFLQTRIQVGLAIRELHFKDCYYLYTEDVEKMKELVQDVHWDGVEQETEDDDDASPDLDDYD